MKYFILVISITLPIIAISQKTEKLIINFSFDKFNISTIAKTKLDSLLQTDTGTIINIDLFGFCDAIGSNKYNYILSIRRAESIKHYLASKNIKQSFFRTLVGFGKSRPLNTNSTVTERSVNRRVEIIINRKLETKLISSVPNNFIDSTVSKQSIFEIINDTAKKVGVNIVLKNINFYGGSHTLMPQSMDELGELLQAMEHLPNLVIEIQGHVCCEKILRDGYDEETRTHDLSINRARAIYNFLIENKINPNRVSYTGLGNRKPLFPDDSEEHKLLNRRVEIKIIKK